MRATVWAWLLDPVHEVEGLVALGPGGGAIGLAHFRPFARPLAASTGGFLDDLFVTPEARGSGAAQALIGAVAGIGRERGWTVLRWITADDNYRGRAVYDRVAEKTRWLTYEIKLALNRQHEKGRPEGRPARNHHFRVEDARTNP